MPDQAPFNVTKLADFGTDEPWVARIWLGIPEIIDGLLIGESSQQAIKDSFSEVAEELSSAYIALERIRALITSKNPALFEIHKEFDAVFDHAWRAYKDRLENAAEELGFNIGFLYVKDEAFESGLQNFISENPGLPNWFGDMIRDERRYWQNKLGEFRNKTLQHKKADGIEKKVFFTLPNAELVFENTWQAIEDIFAGLVWSRFPKSIVLVEIPEDRRDKDCPKRFALHLAPDPVHNHSRKS